MESIGARGEADAEGEEKEEAIRACSGGHVVIARPDCESATHHPNENDESLKIDSSSLNARMVGEPISYQER